MEDIESKKKAEEQAKKELQIVVQVNNKDVTFTVKEATGLEIKHASKVQGVDIQPDFCLFVVKGNHQDPIADDQVVHLHKGMDFDAVDPDHCS